ncbi:HEPN domain-containing protein [Alteromonas sp. A079]|uniref:ApeA N-terminal domain 1-containing protein n=1 Tax=Alteromonas sp. A079 TaxID=3410268 RepID=UPI003BA260DF
MNNKLSESNVASFNIGKNSYLGELKLNGRDTLLRIWGDTRETSVIGHNLPEQIHASLNDLTKVSLIGIHNGGGGTISKLQEDKSYHNRHYCKVYPEFVLYGNRYINYKERCFESLRLFFNHSTVLFNDDEAFNDIIHAKKEVVKNLLLKELETSKELYGFDKSDREMTVGEYPNISLFTGSFQIHSFDSPYGRIEISNCPQRTSASSKGYSLTNRASCTIHFSELLSFEEANEKVAPLLSVFELILGSKLRIDDYQLSVKSESEFPEIIDVYRCIDKGSSYENEDEEPHLGQPLIKVKQNPSEFENVVNKWISSHVAWQDSRWQFFGSFTETLYTTDRLVKVANMFDIVPDEAYGRKVNLTCELIEAKEKARSLFKNLSPSMERDSILGALGRIGTKSLKHKIRDRVNIITNAKPGLVEHIELVTDHAVDCRNHFVHGGNRKFDYYSNFDLVCFFITTLEFVYGASSLIELGWDIERWNQQPSLNHPFNFYLESYVVNLNKLNSIIS